MARAHTIARARRLPRIAAAAALISLLAAAAPSTALPVPALMRLTPIATNLELPIALAPRAGTDAIYVNEQVGRIRVIRDGVLDPAPVLDITGTVSGGLEQGLLGLAFDPADPDFLYINYTDLEGDTHIVEYHVTGDVADTGSRRELLFVDQPFDNHNCGSLKFGPDGYLYICLGDGGDGGDPFGNGQNLDVLLGKMLRIDPRGGGPYGIPASNPFVDEPGRDEIWSYGLRNPWQFSFDRQTGDMWIGEVGQNLWEEIDFQPASSAGGENYGWNQMEGTHPYEGGVEPANHTRPIYEYPHGVGCSVTGGFVYRGAAISGLLGTYLFGDFCAGRLWMLADVAGVKLQVETGLTVPALTAFGEDNAGELYVMGLTGTLFRIDAIV